MTNSLLAPEVRRVTAVRRAWIDRRVGPALCLLALLLLGGRPASAQISLAGGGPQVRVSALGQYAQVAQGAMQTVAVTMDHAPGYHSWPDEAQLEIPSWLGEGFFPIQTQLAMTEASAGLSLDAARILWPQPMPVPVDYLMTGQKQDLLSFKDRSVILVPVNVAADAPLGPASISLKLTYQSCDETTCYPPEEPVLTVGFEVVPAGTDFMGTAVADPNNDFGAGSAGRADDGGVAFNVFGTQFRVGSTGLLGLSTLLLLAALGGLLLNFTPCVLPVLPIKIMGMSRAAGDPRRLVVLGMVMSLGVVAFWLLIGSAIAFVAGFTAISSLFQTGWFSLVVGLFVAVMALGMLGFFDIVLPQAVYRYQPKQETLPGAFGFGVMTAVLSTPCTAPFMGTAAAWSARQQPSITLITFAAIGVGMALPYLLLSLRPALLSKVPRTGPASNVLKQVMGLLMLAVAAFFLGIPIAGALRQAPAPASRDYWWGVTAFVVAAAAWLVWRSVQLTRSPGRRLFFGAVGVAGALGMLSLAPGLSSQGPIEWVYYTPETLAAVKAENKVAVIDFTAEWCLNCKTLEKTVLHRPQITALLDAPDVVPIKVDLTGDNVDGRELLSAMGAVGIPYLVVMGPGTDYAEGRLAFDSYTVDVVREAVGQAGAGASR